MLDTMYSDHALPFNFGSCVGRSRNHRNSISGTTGSLFNLSQPKSNVTPRKSGTGASTSQSSSRAQGDRYSFSSRRSRGTVLSFRSSVFHGAGPESPDAAKRYRAYVSPGGTRSRKMCFRKSTVGRGMDVSPANSSPEVSYVRSRHRCIPNSVRRGTDSSPEVSYVRSRHWCIPNSVRRGTDSSPEVSYVRSRHRFIPNSVRRGTDVSPANSTPEVSYVRSRNPDAANRFRKSGSYVSPSGTVFENNISPNSVSRGTDVSPANSTPEVSRVRSRCAMSSIIL